MRRPCDSQGAQRARLSPIQTETIEDRLLSFGEERPNTAQPTGHVECFDLEFGAGATPAAQHAISQVILHAGMVAHFNPLRYYLSREILICLVH